MPRSSVAPLAALALVGASASPNASLRGSAGGVAAPCPGGPGPWEDCTLRGCCREEGYTCFEKVPSFAQCRPSCQQGAQGWDQPGLQDSWSCRVLEPLQEPPPCAGGPGPLENCLVHKCCATPGYRCYEKDGAYAQCKLSCEPGLHADDPPAHRSPWTCALLWPRAPLRPNPPTPKLEVRSAATNPIIVKGNFLYDSVTGKRFFAKGVTYNPRNVNYNKVRWPRTGACAAGRPQAGELAYDADPAVDELEGQWRENLQAIASLGANVVRLYNIDPQRSHGKFMEAAAALGIYVVVPLTRKDWGFLPAFPSPACYERDIPNYGNVGVNVLTSAKLIVKQFSQWRNTLMFVVANELPLLDHNGYAAFPCVKALTRDIHRYQASCASSMRRVPLVYSGEDQGSPDRRIIAEYLACALEGEDDVVDVLGINMYSWCNPHYFNSSGQESFEASPYYGVVLDFGTFPIPILYTEFGCIIGAFQMQCPYLGGRTWEQVRAIFEHMSEVLSGAIAYEFSMEESPTNFGLTLTPGFLEGQPALYFLETFYALQRQFAEHNVSDRWDGAVAADCAWLPSRAAPLASKRAPVQCPSQREAAALQRRWGVQKVADWGMLPATPDAPLSRIDGQAECPAYEVTEAEAAEACCHMRCGGH